MQRRKLTDALIKRAKPEAGRALYWDTDPKRLALAVEPSGHKSFKLVYSLGGRVRWYNIGNADDIALKDAYEVHAVRRTSSHWQQSPRTSGGWQS